MIKVYVGCCGFPVARKRYFEYFKVVELQNTFYDLPTEEEARKLRSEIPSDAIVSMKAWQAITHPPSSPTWRRMKRFPKGDKANYGFLRPTKENLEAWNEMMKIARILDAKIIVLQTPPSFGYSEEHVKYVYEFLKTIEKNNIIIGWEPRGDWYLHEDKLAKLIQDLDIIHIADIFKHKLIINDRIPIAYTRLHGIGPGEVNYRYRYTDDDLMKLKDYLIELGSKVKEVYVMFNNIYMFDDARRFRDLLKTTTSFHVE